MGLMAHCTCLGVGSSLRMKRWNRCEGFSGVCWLLRSVPGPVLRELVLLEASRVAIATGALRPTLGAASQTGSCHFANTRKGSYAREAVILPAC